MQALNVEAIESPNKRILVVDDYPPTRQLIREALNQSTPYEISEAENGRQALEMCRQTPFDLVISDLMMPCMGGMELLGNLRDISPDTSVIMITGFPDVELTVSAMKKGAVDFLKKPFQMDDLVFKVNICLCEKKLFTEVAPKGGSSELQIRDKTEALTVRGYIYDSFDDIEGENEEIFNKIAELSMKVVGGEECSLLLFDEESGGFDAKIIQSRNIEAYEQRTIPALKRIFDQVVRKKEALMVHSSEYPEIAPSLICAPLLIRNNVFGILSIRRKTNREIFTAKDLHYIVSLTKRASLNLENRILYESVYSNVMETFSALIASIQVRDHYTEAHCSRVTRLSVKTAEVMRCSEKEIESIKIAGMLHDVGKIAIPDRILLKPDKLTPAEAKIIKTHPDLGERILKPILLFDRERDIIRHHHERWDGKGYPERLAGTEIPLLSRIVAVADSFDAMTNDRPYRRSLGREAAIAELGRRSDRQFDRQAVEAFLETL